MSELTILEMFREAIHRDPVPVLGIIFGCTAGTIIVTAGIIAKAWRSVRRMDAETALKQEMLERGMGAEEIQRVIQASGRSMKR